MATTPITIEPSDFGPDAVGTTLTINLDEMAIGAEVAEAMASAITAGIRAQSPKWVKTGTLAGGITVVVDGQRHAVCAPSNRIGQPELLGKLRNAVAELASPLASAAVVKAIESALSKAIKVGK